MKDKLLLIIGIVVIIVLAIVVILLARSATISSAANPAVQGCNYNNPNRSYMRAGPNCIINFMCIQGRQAFRDACGCGCEISSN